MKRASLTSAKRLCITLKPYEITIGLAAYFILKNAISCHKINRIFALLAMSGLMIVAQKVVIDVLALNN